MLMGYKGRDGTTPVCVLCSKQSIDCACRASEAFNWLRYSRQCFRSQRNSPGPSQCQIFCGAVYAAQSCAFSQKNGHMVGSPRTADALRSG